MTDDPTTLRRRSIAAQGRIRHGSDESAKGQHAPIDVAILALRECSAAVMFGMFDMFRGAGREWNLLTTGSPGPLLMAPRLVARSRQPLQTTNGVSFEPHATLDECGGATVVCVPDLAIGVDEPLADRFDAEVQWLRDAADRGAFIATACSGALLLAETGLLDGEDATTHWAYCDRLAQRHPKIRVRAERALVTAGPGQRFLMAGGGTSFVDLALFIIARTLGVDIAMQVARVNLIDWHRIGQQPFAQLTPPPQAEDAAISRCQLWVAEHYDEKAPVAAMAELSGLSERTFERRFRRTTGMSPLEYVQFVRLEEAKQALETESTSIEAIALSVGYEDPAHFVRLFRKHVRLTPLQYRRRFGALRMKLAASG